MSRVLVLVEGQTEEVFVKQVMAPTLAKRGVYLIPTILTTKKTKSGRQFKGGVSSFSKIRRDLRPLLHDSNATAVTTMLDYYGLPSDFPGFDTAPENDVYERVEHLEASLGRELDDPRLLPYLSVHEFEALVLAGPDELARSVPRAGLEETDELRTLLAGVGSPEEINDGESTHPFARLERWFPGYQKTLHGRLVTGQIGLSRLREACPHFGRWVSRLEELA